MIACMATSRWPAQVEPMLANPGPMPDEPGWAYEYKWDGVRALAYTDGAGGLRLMSRNDLDMSPSYPELAVLGARLPRVILDGEIVTLDRHGSPSFSALQRRMHVRAPSADLVASAPVRYVVFDVLYLGRSLVAKPWQERRSRLESLDLDEPPVTMAAYFTQDPAAVMAVAKERGLEGVVSKRVTAPYRPGRRSPEWTKTPLIQTTEVIITGWKPGAGRREGMIGSLLLAAYDPTGELAFIGGVGTGFTDAMLGDLAETLRPLERETSPFAGPLPAAEVRGARWVEPTVVGEVVYRSFTPDGRLRHSSWRGVRPDRNPDEVRLKLGR
jgi:bifunctional non-homologous end joining protein LigD